MEEDIEHAGCNAVYDDGRPLDPRMNQNHCKVGQDKAALACVLSDDIHRAVATVAAEGGHIPRSLNCADKDNTQDEDTVDHVAVVDDDADTCVAEEWSDAAEALLEDHSEHALL